MNQLKDGADNQKAKYAYLENVGCLLFFIIGGVCSSSTGIMYRAFDSSNPIAGALAVAALAAMGVGVTYFLVRAKSD